MQTTTITCDGCGRDLSSTGNCEDWRLALVNEPIPSKGGVVTAMGIDPCLPRSHHFCGTYCVKKWIDKKYEKAAEAKSTATPLPGLADTDWRTIWSDEKQ